MRESDGSFDFLGVVTPSGWQRHGDTMPNRANLLAALEPVFRRADSEGGAAKLAFGDRLQVFLPPGGGWNPDEDVDAAI